MQAFAFSRSTLSIVAAAVLLSACANSSIPSATGSATVDGKAAQHSKTFDYTGKEQTFIVPAGVTRLTVIAHGGQGGYHGDLYVRPACYHPCDYDSPGFPGRVYAVIAVRPGDKLYVVVGASGDDGGFNGGGAGGAAGYGGGRGASGGGASDIRIGGDSIKDRVVVAAGGGGVGEYVGIYYQSAPGGNGGGLDGQSGGSDGYSIDGGGGDGGTQTEGGPGGSGGQGSKKNGNGQSGGTGKLADGGSGGNGGAGPKYYGGLPGGGGGGGYYGGGGGGGGGNYNNMNYDEASSGGGGGGSSYVEPSAITSLMWTGWRAQGDGRVILSWN